MKKSEFKTVHSQESTTTKGNYQCPLCNYIYDPLKGDILADIPPGTPFEALPDNYVCPFCGETKETFKAIM